MSAALKLFFYVLVPGPLVLGGLFIERHPDWLRRQILAVSAPPAEAAPAAVPGARSSGRHALTESPPLTVPDLDRLVAVGFTTEQIVSEIERRGVLHLPEPAERDHIQTLPGGSRLLDVMDSPGNLVDDAALARFGKRQAGGESLGQVHATSQSVAAQTVASQVRVQAENARRQQSAEYQRRYNALSTQIATLKQQRADLQRRGEVAAMVTIQIDRLERERAALVLPY